MFIKSLLIACGLGFISAMHFFVLSRSIFSIFIGCSTAIFALFVLFIGISSLFYTTEEIEELKKEKSKE